MTAAGVCAGPDLRERLEGLLLGTAVGDALGLPAEGLPRKRIVRRWGGGWNHRFFLNRGMVSDDTEHTLFVAQALLDHPLDADGFRRALAWKLRWWLLGLPAGVGFATLRAIIKLWVGWSPRRSGVFSAGNGPAMRSGILGAYFHDDPSRRRDFVRASTRLTHTDPRALTGSLAVAELVAWEIGCANRAAGAGRSAGAPEEQARVAELLTRLGALADDHDGEWARLVERIGESLALGRDVEGFADELGLARGVTGYVYHTVPVAVYAWLRHRGSFERAVSAALSLGGDTDTVGAIVGAMAGAATGPRGIPPEWLAGIAEWPRTPALLRKVAGRLALQRDAGAALGGVHYFWPGVVPRNIFFLVVVLLHGLRRLLPV